MCTVLEVKNAKKNEILRPGGSVGAGVVIGLGVVVIGGSIGFASGGRRSHAIVSKNANSSTATKLSSLVPLVALSFT